MNQSFGQVEPDCSSTSSAAVPSSGSSSSSSSDLPEGALKAWHLASEQPVVLSPAHQQLLELLGVSQFLLQWLSIQTCMSPASTQVQDPSIQDTLRTYCACCQVQSERDVVVGQELRLLPHMLLQWVDDTTSTSGQLCGCSAEVAAAFSRRSLVCLAACDASAASTETLTGIDQLVPVAVKLLRQLLLQPTATTPGPVSTALEEMLGLLRVMAVLHPVPSANWAAAAAGVSTSLQWFLRRQAASPTQRLTVLLSRALELYVTDKVVGPRFMLQQALAAGVGSRQLTHVHSLLVTVVKVCARWIQEQPNCFSGLDASVKRYTSITASATQSVLLFLSQTARTAVEAGDDSRAADAVAAMLPWLSLIGRSLQCQAPLLQSLQAKLKSDALAGRLQSAAAHAQTYGNIALWSSLMLAACSKLLPRTEFGCEAEASHSICRDVQCSAQSVEELVGEVCKAAGVEVGDIEGLLTKACHVGLAAGKAVKQVLHHPHLAGNTSSAAQRSRNHSSSSSRAPAPAKVVSAADVVSFCEEAVVGEYVAALQAVGAALGSVPNNLCCNNPGCTSLRKAEMPLVVGYRKCKCAGCRLVYYCGRQCQAAHWQIHKPVCRAVQARQQQAGLVGGDALHGAAVC
jgi:hypothetical protein